MILAGGLMMASGDAANALTADEVLNKMSEEQQHGYVSGIVDGFAYARWLSDKPDKTGMSCIFDWYYNGQSEKWELIHTWFERHSDKHVDALMYVLIEKECGD